MCYLAYIIIFLSISISIEAQVTIGSSIPPNTGALLDLKTNVNGSSEKGLGLSRVSLKTLSIDIERGETNMAKTVDGTTPTDEWDKDAHIGLLVYNVNKVETLANRICPGVHVWNGESWSPLKPYPNSVEVRELNTSIPLIRGFIYLDPTNPNGWPQEKEADRLSGKFSLGHSSINNTPDLQDTRGSETRTYTTSRFYVGYRTITRAYTLKRNEKCDSTTDPAWSSETEITETEKIFTDGVWMTQNLSTVKTPAGIGIPLFAISNPTKSIQYQTVENDPLHDYGLLYNWYAAINVGTGVGQIPDPGNVNQVGGNNEDVNIQGICPAGWHLPSDQEWTDLENGIILKTSIFSDLSDLGEAQTVSYDAMDWLCIAGLGTAMKSKIALSTKMITRGESKANSLGGFDAYLTGHFNADINSTPPKPSYKDNNAYFWSASSFGSTDAFRRSLYTEFAQQNDHRGIHRAWSSRDDLFSLRCLKN